ncbi:polyprenyl synthetase family protein [Desulfuribacillus alkaliarsenatis]|uniref:Farnesyl diphosphate synthase n=1 Tax=Desulfuribacillus alkaliarsenatis TaxID=766136 RepID=A0A1E5G5Q1_9FIRM|nr:farnesyl diphosphate synthase [Desulfuribacillus alkaliarsenatis]OEF98449.1 hypothetical protein BHF68_01880 [Desulfuribacillus alkaliarsenatis]
MRIEFNTFINSKIATIDKALDKYLQKVEPHPGILYESIRYSMFAGGKRLRPVLTLTTAEAFGCEAEKALPIACAIEMIHTYSLIHDDLPAMDDDDFRRGKLTNHKVYNEAIAILAGDALLTKAFKVLANATDLGVDPIIALQLIDEISEAAGAEGMVGGQVADMEAEGKRPSIEQLEYIHRHKTGALFTIAIRAGAIVAGVKNESLAAITDFASKLGLAYQIQDDILDIIGDEKTIGKSVGSDLMNDKATYPALLGLDESKKQVQKLTEEALLALDSSGCKESKYLRAIADYLVARDS